MHKTIVGALATVIVVVALAIVTVATTRHSAFALGGLDAGVAVVASPDGNGYAIISGTGGQYNYGSSRFSGSLAGHPLAAPIVDAASVPGAGDAKWFVGADGGVFTQGAGTGFYGSMGGQRLNAPMTAILASRTGRGYLLVAKDGGTFAFGDFPPAGSLASMRLNAPIVDAATTPDNRGLWLVGADGGVFALGAAQFYGSMGGQRLNAPATAILASSTGRGYLVVGQDGGTFAFGDYPFPGSLSQLSLNAPVVDAVASSAGEGAWLLGQDGGIFALKSPFYGNAVDEANPPPVFPGTVIGNGGYVKVPCPGGGSVTVAAQIAQNTSNLLAAARQGGIILCGWGWRSTETQIQLRKKNCGGDTYYNIWQKPASQCEPDTAIPGRSQHERGLAIDFFNAQGTIKKPSREFEWLKQHAGTYGLKNLPSEAWHWSTTGR